MVKVVEACKLTGFQTCDIRREGLWRLAPTYGIGRYVRVVHSKAITTWSSELRISVPTECENGRGKRRVVCDQSVTTLLTCRMPKAYEKIEKTVALDSLVLFYANF